MFRLVIADDDEILLKGLSTMFDWTSLGVQVVASVDDGDKALEAVNKFNADILLTDIKMTNMDGLAVAAKIKEDNLNTTVIVMSAYDDFQYAQQALRLAVHDYLVKPIDLRLLEETIRKIISFRMKEIYQRQEVQKLEEANKTNLEEEFYKSVILNEYSKEECLQQAENFLLVEGLSWKLIEIIVDHKKLHHDVRQKLRKICEKREIKWIELNRNSNLACCNGSPDNMKENIELFKEECRTLISNMISGGSVSFINGTLVNNIYELNLSYQCIERIKEFLYIEQKAVDLYEEDIQRYHNNNHTLNKSIIEYLVQIVLYGKEGAIHDYVGKLEQNLKSAGKNSKIMFLFALSIFLVELNKRANDRNINIENFHEQYNISYKEMVTKEKLSEAMDCFEGMLIRFTEQLHEEESISNKGIVKKAYQYIENNFSNPELRISDVAKHVNLSQNYFSTIFMNEVGISFTDYLIQRRMKEAQQLIVNTDYRSSEVAAMVGYDNPTYFSTIFKKYTGVTVSQYRSYVHS